MISIPEVIETLKRLKLPPDILIKTETELEAIEADKKNEAEGAAPKAKSQYGILLLDPENKLVGLGDFTGLVVQVPEQDDIGTALDRVHQAVYDQRAAAKRRIKPIQTVGEAASAVKRKFFKARNISAKTKEPVRVLITDGKIP